ncbi:MAG: type II toxin-antitoxin system RelB/DinJ family antitoxin [Spirochaetaceae bacterium]|nr:type II toxin-antitoxin system RelB/DinJ family antitoxin [Spirochaetaceae bacterium]
MNTVIRARIDERVKEEAAAVLEAVGLTVSDAFRLLMVRTAAEKRLPFEPLVPSEETVAAMLAARRADLVAVGRPDEGQDHLRAALSDLDEAVTDAAEEGLPRPTGDAIQSARRLLTQMYAIAPQRFEVYPTADGEIALDLPNERGSVILLCDSQGGALCLVNVNGVQRRARYSTATNLPDGFVREALIELGS